MELNVQHRSELRLGLGRGGAAPSRQRPPPAGAHVTLRQTFYLTRSHTSRQPSSAAVARVSAAARSRRHLTNDISPAPHALRWTLLYAAIESAFLGCVSALYSISTYRT